MLNERKEQRAKEKSKRKERRRTNASLTRPSHIFLQSCALSLPLFLLSVQKTIIISQTNKHDETDRRIQAQHFARTLESLRDPELVLTDGSVCSTEVQSSSIVRQSRKERRRSSAQSIFVVGSTKSEEKRAR